MTTINKPISPLRQRMIEDMTLRKLSPKTQLGQYSMQISGVSGSILGAIQQCKASHRAEVTLMGTLGITTL